MSTPRSFLASAGLLLVALAAGVSRTSPFHPGFHDVWDALYPESESDDNLIQSPLGLSCYLCHLDNHEWNPYGWRMRQLIDEGLSPSEALLAIEDLDSDGDLAGATDLEEIEAGTQPGWKAGATNTTYHRDGTVRSNQPPPPGILGLLDPPCGTPATAMVRNGSGVNPPCLASAGAPVLGTKWALEVDASVVPGATATLVECRMGQVAGPSLEIGELLIDRSSALVFVSLLQRSAGTLHEVAVPANPELLGFEASVQGAVLVEGRVRRLCNALDFVLGCDS